MKPFRIVAFLAALGAFIVHMRAADDEGVNPVPIVLGTFAGIAVLAWVLIAVARYRRQRRVAALLVQRPGWDAAVFLSAIPAGSPAGTPIPTLRTGVLLFSSTGIELLGGNGARTPYEHLLVAPWSQVDVTASRVQFVAGRVVTRAGLTLEVVGQPTRQLSVIPERSLRARFPGPTAPEQVLAAMRARRQLTDDTVGS